MDKRAEIIATTYQLSKTHGFEKARADKMLMEHGVPKGTLYHYFKSKKELGLAMIHEALIPEVMQRWNKLHENQENPIEQILDILDELDAEFTPEVIKIGDPLNNLIFELSHQDEDYRIILNEITSQIQMMMESCIEAGKANGTLIPEVHSKGLSNLIVASLMGAQNMSKTAQSREPFETTLEEIKQYLVLFLA